MTSLCEYLLSYTVYLCVKQLNKSITMFFNVKTYLWLHNMEKTKISTISVRTFMYNHVKVEKPQHDIATCNNKQWFGGNLHVLKRAWNGSMHCIFVIPKKLMLLVYIHFKTIVLFSNLSTCFPTPQNNFCSYRRIFHIIPYPHPSHPKELGG